MSLAPSEDVPSVSSTIIRAVVAGIPYVGGPLEVLITDTITRRQARGREAADATRKVVGDDELLLARLIQDERLADMFLDAIDTATRTALRAKCSGP